MYLPADTGYIAPADIADITFNFSLLVTLLILWEDGVEGNLQEQLVQNTPQKFVPTLRCEG